jgi:DmsE family decaheme c-type cytochrome
MDGVSAACAECHADVAHDFEFNERHRLQEGILTCTSCHDPHGPSDRMRLAAFKQEACIDCHTDKGGPFVYEHGSSRVDGCVACHTPHGSVNRHLLTFQATGELCYSCHAVVPAFHVAGSPPRFGLDTNCTNCHSSIHGSNLDPFFLK